MLNKIIDRFLYWLWYKEIEFRLRNQGFGLFIWKMQKWSCYDKAFERGGLKEVLKEHEAYHKKLGEYIKEMKDVNQPL